MQTPIEEAAIIVAQLEKLEQHMRSCLSEEARDNLEAFQRHERNPDQSPETFFEGMDFYNRMLEEEDGKRIWEYRILEDTLLRARWMLTMLEQESTEN